MLTTTTTSPMKMMMMKQDVTCNTTNSSFASITAEDTSTMEEEAPSPSPQEEDNSWSQEEQEEFIAVFLPLIQGRVLRDEDIQLIRNEAKAANLPLECVDRLLQQSSYYTGRSGRSGDSKKQTKQQRRRGRRHESQQQQQPPLEDDHDLDDCHLVQEGWNSEIDHDIEVEVAAVQEEEEEELAQQDLPEQHCAQPENFDLMEEVDESDNIMAYFARMNSLKRGGHLPRLNTEAIESFVYDEKDRIPGAEDVEIDLDVGYINRSLDMTLEHHEHDAEDNDDETVVEKYNCDDSIATFDDEEHNRYEPAGYTSPTTTRKKTDAFESLLLMGGGGPPGTSRHVTWDKALGAGVEVIETFAAPPPQEEMTPAKEEMTTEVKESLPEEPVVIVKKKPLKEAMRCYGHDKDLSEWRRKRNMALWKPPPKSASSMFACHSDPNPFSVADERQQGSEAVLRPPPRLQGMTAIRRLRANKEERRQRRNEMGQIRHVPEKYVVAPKSWQLPYRERTQVNPGYIGVDQYSLYQSTCPVHQLDQRDAVPWELREVKQHFLYDQSVAEFNWFGK